MNNRAPVPCIINNTPYPNLKGAMRAEGLPSTGGLRANIRHNLKAGRAVQIGDGPLIIPCVEVVLL